MYSEVPIYEVKDEAYRLSYMDDDVQHAVLIEIWLTVWISYKDNITALDISVQEIERDVRTHKLFKLENKEK